MERENGINNNHPSDLEDLGVALKQKGGLSAEWPYWDREPNQKFCLICVPSQQIVSATEAILQPILGRERSSMPIQQFCLNGKPG